MSSGLIDRDPLHPERVAHASGLLRQFNQAGVLVAADVHVARRLAALAGVRDEAVLLAVALAVRAPRLGHVLVDLARIRDTAAVDADEPVDLGALPWPETSAWVALVAQSPLVAAGDGATDPAVSSVGARGDAATAPGIRPLQLTGTWLYLDRYWAEEVQVAASLLTMGADPAPGVDGDRLSTELERLYGDEAGSRQALAAAAAVRRRLAVVAGGPGTGKTTTVARIVALLCDQASAAGLPFPLIALAAPTGKAAARLEEAVHAEAAALPVDGPVREHLLALHASTLHRLLGRRPGSESRFRHDRNQRLAHDVVIIDETSMVSLTLIARVIEALRSDARLVLVGDPGQLASIEAGAVLGDIVGPAADGGSAADRGSVAGRGSVADRGSVAEGESSPGRTGIASGIVVLDQVHRFGGGIAELAGAIRGGDPDEVVALLRRAPSGVQWIEADVGDEDASDRLAPVRDGALTAARAVLDAARAGAATEALDALGRFRILCAHRRGPYGVATWTAMIESWLEAEVEGFTAGERWYAGRPLLVTENDYELRLNNGDTGVVVTRGSDRLAAAFERAGETVEYSPSRLGAIDTVYAMTIHKSQGSQFGAAAVLLPDPGSRILTRELLYTAATRARQRLILVGTEEAVRGAVTRPVARASGLRWRLWGGDPVAPVTG